MKLIFNEYDSFNYGSYKFPYCVYAIKEPSDKYIDIYSLGFLPYSGNLDISEEIFYLARSVRINLKGKVFNYKQNNVLNKFADVYDHNKLSFVIDNKPAVSGSAHFREWCLTNAKGNFLSKDRLEYIISRPYLKNILTIYYDEVPLAVMLFVSENNDFFHCWYSFYDLKKEKNDFGKWIILKTIEYCKLNGYEYFYIGTCYSMSAFYKLTLSPNTEFFNGSDWSREISYLKNKLKSHL